MPPLSANARIERIDERTEAMLATISRIEAGMDKLNTVVFTGNGRESLVTRMSRVEDDQDRFAQQCSICQATILSPAKVDQGADDGKLAEVAIQALAGAKTSTNEVVIERWKALALIIGAAFGVLSLTLQAVQVLAK
jgi:hypothetical protein